MELTDEDREYIANQIIQGYTSGITGQEDENDEEQMTKLSWELKVNKWKD